MFNVGAAVGYLKLNTTGWNAPMRGATASINQLSRTFLRMGVVATTSLILITREFGKFDKAIRHATSVSETTNEQFQQMSEMALDASVRWNKAATSTAQAFYYLGSAGLTVKEQLEAFNDTIMLSRAMGSELAQTVEGMVDIVRAFGLEFADVTNIADQLTKTVISSNQSFRSLDQALTYASSTARLTNNTLAETNAMLGIMANAGIKGSMAGTVLRRAMTNLMSPTGAMAGLIYELGLNIYDTTGQMRSFIDIMGDISDRLVNTTDEYKNMVFEVLFGRRAIAGQITLFNYGSVALRKYATEIKNAAGTTERVAGKQMKAFTEQLGRLWQEMRRVAIVVGGTLAPAIERLGDSLRNRLGAFREYIQANKEAVAELLKWVAVVGVAALIIPPLLLSMAGLTALFASLALSIVKAGAALATNPFTYIIAGLYLLGALLRTDFWKQAWTNQIKPFLTAMSEGFTQSLTQIMWEFSLIPEQIKRSFSGEGVLNTLRYFTKALQQIGLAARMAGAAFTFDFAEVERLSREFNKINEEMRDLISGPRLDGGRRSMFGSQAERTASYQAYIKNLKGVGKEIVWQGKSIAIEYGKALKEQIEKDAKALKGLFTGLGAALPEGLTRAFLNLQTLLKTFMIEPDAGLAKLLDDLDAFSIKLRKSAVDWSALNDVGNVSGRQASYLAGEWSAALTALFRPPVGTGQTWAGAFKTTLETIQSAWADTIVEMIDEGGTFKDFMENMFLDVLRAFNRMIAEITAAQLLHKLFGGDVVKRMGTPSLMDIIKAKPRFYSPSGGVKMPPLQGGGYAPLGPTFQSALIGGAGKMVPITINLDNTGLPMSARVTGQRFDDKQYIINVVLEEYDTNPNVRNRLGG